MKLSYNVSVAARLRDNNNTQHTYTGDMMAGAANNINNQPGHQT